MMMCHHGDSSSLIDTSVNVICEDVHGEAGIGLDLDLD